MHLKSDFSSFFQIFPKCQKFGKNEDIDKNLRVNNSDDNGNSHNESNNQNWN